MKHHAFDQIFQIMQASFPEIEYREYDDQLQLLSNPYYRILTEENEQGEIIGFLAGWEFEQFRYIEHISVAPHIRGGGIGKHLMERFMNQSALPVILEVEPPHDELQQRRVGFYKRLGFQLGHHAYVQPPLRRGNPDFPLCIMSYPEPLTNQQFERIKDQLYREVYNVENVSI